MREQQPQLAAPSRASVARQVSETPLVAPSTPCSELASPILLAGAGFNGGWVGWKCEDEKERKENVPSIF